MLSQVIKPHKAFFTCFAYMISGSWLCRKQEEKRQITSSGMLDILLFSIQGIFLGFLLK
jgi:hypothetical protein